MASRRSIRFLRSYAAMLVAALVSPASGAPAVAVDGDEEGPTPPEANNGRIHLSLGADWVSQYFFRGVVQEDEGLIVQPWFDLGVSLVEREDMNLAFNVGLWNSVHSNADSASATDSFVEHWYEADIYGSLGLETGPWSFGLTYTFYTSPSDAFETIDELSVSAAFDDSTLWDGGFALNPSATIALETGDAGADGGRRGMYLELAVEPGFDWRINDDLTAEVAFPVTLGLSVDDYYEDAAGDDDLFGYLDVGVSLTMPLDAPVGYGRWSFGASVHLLWLGDHAAAYNDGDDVEIIGSVGLAIEY